MRNRKSYGLSSQLCYLHTTKIALLNLCYYRIAKIPNKFNKRCESIVNGLRSEAAEDAPLKIKHDVHSHT